MGHASHLSPEIDSPTSAGLEFTGSIGWRHLVVLLMFILALICYADRTNIGIVIAEGNLLGPTGGTKGEVLSAFFVGYLCTQFLGGAIADRWGGKTALLLAAGAWTVFDVLTPVAALAGFMPLYLARVGVGLGEGLLLPAQLALLSFWVPLQERGFLVAIVTSGQEFGCVMAGLVSPWLLQRSASRVFNTWGVAAVVASLSFLGLGASAPELHAGSSRTGEAKWIQERRTALHIAVVQRTQSAEPLVPWRIFRAPSAWAIIIAHAGGNYAWYSVLSWLPTFYVEVHGVVLTSSPWLLAAPYFVSFLGMLLVGRVSDALIARQYRTRHVRKAAQITSAVGLTLFLQLTARAPTAGWAAIFASAATLFIRLAACGFWVNIMDVCPETAARFTGISNTSATLPGVVGQLITQKILDATRLWPVAAAWSLVFAVGGIVALVGAAIFALLGDDMPIDRSPQHTDLAPASCGAGAVVGRPSRLEDEGCLEDVS